MNSRNGKLRSSIVGALLLVTSVMASAEPPLNQRRPTAATISDDEKRLRCFDDLFSTKRSERGATATASPKSNWSIVEGTSPNTTARSSAPGLRWEMQRSFCDAKNKRRKQPSRPGTLFWGRNPLRSFSGLICKIPVKKVWWSSMDGRAAFAPHPVDFIRALPDSGRVFIRALSADGNNKDANFQLAGVSEIREKIARACNWPPA